MATTETIVTNVTIAKGYCIKKLAYHHQDGVAAFFIKAD
jgi:hypothetical protein